MFFGHFVSLFVFVFQFRQLGEMKNARVQNKTAGLFNLRILIYLGLQRTY